MGIRRKERNYGENKSQDLDLIARAHTLLEIIVVQHLYNYSTYLCTPLQSKQNTVPKLTLAHCGFFIPHSQHLSFPGIERTVA